MRIIFTHSDPKEKTKPIETQSKLEIVRCVSVFGATVLPFDSEMACVHVKQHNHHKKGDGCFVLRVMHVLVEEKYSRAKIFENLRQLWTYLSFIILCTLRY